MGPTWVLLAPDGPHVGPWALLSGCLLLFCWSSAARPQPSAIPPHDCPSNSEATENDMGTYISWPVSPYIYKYIYIYSIYIYMNRDKSFHDYNKILWQSLIIHMVHVLNFEPLYASGIGLDTQRLELRNKNPLGRFEGTCDLTFHPCSRWRGNG